jgi:ABC-type proline/glycine betaine transport system ATPase subunit
MFLVLVAGSASRSGAGSLAELRGVRQDRVGLARAVSLRDDVTTGLDLAPHADEPLE